MARQKRLRRGSGGSEATGVSVGTFIVGVSKFIPGHPITQSFLVFLAPFVAVVVNSYVKRSIDDVFRIRKLRKVLRVIEDQIMDPQATEMRRSKLLKVREELLEAELKHQLEDFDLV